MSDLKFRVLHQYPLDGEFGFQHCIIADMSHDVAGHWNNDLVVVPASEVVRLEDEMYSAAHVDRLNELIKRLTAEKQGVTAENERLLRALWYNKNRAGVGMYLSSERIDALKDIYETSRDALADTAQESGGE